MNEVYLKILSIPAILIALCIHEYAHGRMAYALGDPTAKYMGRLTLNPLRHLDPLGALMMLLVGFGWAKPVPVNTRYFKNVKRDMALTALAGPFSNFLLAILAAFLHLLVGYSYGLLAAAGLITEPIFYLWRAAYDFFYLLHVLNLSLGLFNLIPLPPLDGSRILGVLLPERAYETVMRYERQIYYGVLAWLFLGPTLVRYLLKLSVVATSPTLRVLVKLLSPTGFLGDAVSFLSDLIFRVFSLIPFLSF